MHGDQVPKGWHQQEQLWLCRECVKAILRCNLEAARKLLQRQDDLDTPHPAGCGCQSCNPHAD